MHDIPIRLPVGVIQSLVAIQCWKCEGRGYHRKFLFFKIGCKSCFSTGEAWKIEYRNSKGNKVHSDRYYLIKDLPL